MKNLLIIFIAIFSFYGCTKQPVQESVVSYKDSSINKKLKVVEENVNKDDHQASLDDNIILEEKKLANENIAIVYASNSIGKYSIEATNTAMSFLINKNIQFNLKVIDIVDETKENIHNVLDSLKNMKIEKVIFFATNGKINYINEYSNLDAFKIYLPLVHRSFYNSTDTNMIFGGIDYTKQFDKLYEEVEDNLVEIYDDSMIGMILHDQFKAKYANIQSIKIEGKNPRYSRILKQNKSLEGSSVILNMPIVKSSILLSQIRANDISITKSLSTQINYSPLLFVLTQKEDRNNFYVVNAIEKLPSDIEEINLLLENDVLYNWVNFSTILGLEYLLTQKEELFGKINIINNQVQYNLNIYKTDDNKFTHYKSVK